MMTFKTLQNTENILFYFSTFASLGLIKIQSSFAGRVQVLFRSCSVVDLTNFCQFDYHKVSNTMRKVLACYRTCKKDGCNTHQMRYILPSDSSASTLTASFSWGRWLGQEGVPLVVPFLIVLSLLS